MAALYIPGDANLVHLLDEEKTTGLILHVSGIELASILNHDLTREWIEDMVNQWAEVFDDKFGVVPE